MNETLVQTHTSIFPPLELWNAIFRRVEKKDLTTLARVSRLFQQEAEYILYHRVDLRAVTDGARLTSWCMSIVGKRRRASRVHTLWFPGSFKPPSGDSRAEIQRLLAQAFKAIVNLKELYVFAMTRTVDDSDSGVPTIIPSTFDNCTFRLTGLLGWFTALSVDDMWEFLSTQPDISYWVPSDPFIKSISAILPNTLPSLREVVLVRPEKLPLFYSRPIQRLVLTFQDIAHTEYDGLAAIHSLRRFEDTLRVLSYTVFGLLVDWTMSDVVRSLAHDAPNLDMLTLFFHFQCTVTTDEQTELAEAVAPFERLHSLVLSFNMAALHDPNTDPPDPSNPLEHHPIWPPDSSPAQCRKVASMFMVSCPSLRHISFPFTDKSTAGGDNLKRVVDLCYGRSPSGEAELEGFYVVDSTSWWMK